MIVVNDTLLLRVLFEARRMCNENYDKADIKELFYKNRFYELCMEVDNCNTKVQLGKKIDTIYYNEKMKIIREFGGLAKRSGSATQRLLFYLDDLYEMRHEPLDVIRTYLFDSLVSTKYFARNGIGEVWLSNFMRQCTTCNTSSALLQKVEKTISNGVNYK